MRIKLLYIRIRDTYAKWHQMNGRWYLWYFAPIFSLYNLSEPHGARSSQILKVLIEKSKSQSKYINHNHVTMHRFFLCTFVFIAFEIVLSPLRNFFCRSHTIKTKLDSNRTQKIIIIKIYFAINLIYIHDFNRF